MKDKELIKGCISGDGNCQKQLYNLYAPKMFTVALRYARHRMEAEDILQDSFIKIFRNLGQLRSDASVEYWIRRIVINTAIKTITKTRNQKELIGIEPNYDRAVEPGVIEYLSEQELLGYIAMLPDGYRIVFNMYVVEGYSHKEIGEELGIQESTSRSQLVKARRFLNSKIVKESKLAV